MFGCHDQSPIETGPRVGALAASEERLGLREKQAYAAFDEQVRETKRKLLDFLIEAKRNGKTVAGYGAPGKGNTLLNYCGIRSDFVDYTVDRNPYKHGKFLPGTHIPIHPPERIRETRPDYVLILPWNLRDEIVRQLAYIREWDAKFVVPIPSLTAAIAQRQTADQQLPSHRGLDQVGQRPDRSGGVPVAQHEDRGGGKLAVSDIRVQLEYLRERLTRGPSNARRRT